MKEIMCNDAESNFLREISVFLRLKILFPQPGHSGLNLLMTRG